MFLKSILISSLILSFGCSSPEVQRIKKRFLGVGNTTIEFSKIKPGMSHEEVVKTLNEQSESNFEISKVEILHKFTDGFVVEKDSVVESAYLYPEIQPEDTMNTLVNLGDPVIEIFKKAGWPLRVIAEGNAHALYYRTGTLLLKDFELINTFNRNVDYQMSLSAYKGEPVIDPKYYIVPSVKGIDRNSLEFIEVKKYVAHILESSKGKVTENLREANVILFVNFGVGDRNIDILTYSTPIYLAVYTPGTTSTTQVTNQYGQNIGSFHTTSAGTYSNQYAGQSTSQYKVESYRRHLMLEAVHASDLKLNGERRYFWKITTESIGVSDDFRAILPVLAYGASGYIYKNSGKSVGIRIDFEQMISFFLKVYSKK